MALTRVEWREKYGLFGMLVYYEIQLVTSVMAAVIMLLPEKTQLRIIAYLDAELAKERER